MYRYAIHHALSLAALALLGIAAQRASAAAEPPAEISLEQGFQQPPESARPWVYWFWLNGNITREGITADLEAMRRVGVGGVLIMEVDQGAPVGPVAFMSPQWRELFKHVDTEARRLGLEVNMNNDAGWNGSGGPWIKPQQAMQEVTWTETEVTGPQRFEAVLPQPKAVAGFYQDIAVQAVPAVGNWRLPDFESKGAFQRRGGQPPNQGTLAPEGIIAPTAIIDLGGAMNRDGRLVWDVPTGRWTILRIGHTPTGAQNAPAPATGRGLECDKLSQEGIEANFDGMMARLAADTGAIGRTPSGGLVATHIDSWENGSQNWTPKMRQEFTSRRGYDLTAYLPVLTGRVVGSLELSERFLWDVRRTVSELVIENYAGHFRRLANRHGMRFTVEAYGSPCDYIPYAGQSDEPMGEFWTPSGGAMETCRGMASAGHIYGKRIVGAEAFTSGDQERWREHPASLKALGDQAFCEGINRFVFHRYAMQPWLDYQPGMTMGPWGQHYERTQTWWDQSPAWHSYLARCQFLLRQGHFVADICYLQPQNSPAGFGNHPRAGYGWDECTDDAVLTRMSVRDGRLVLPDGMSYRLLALSDSRAMTPALVAKLKELVEAGATVLGPRPLTSPSLSDYPQCDDQVQQSAAELWDDCDGQRVKERAVGRGRIVWGLTAEKFLQQSSTPPDFRCARPWQYHHRTTEGAEIYFVANGQPFQDTATCGFRVAGKTPELWWPESGRIERAGVWESKAGTTWVSLTLESGQSVFVVFRSAGEPGESLIAVRRAGRLLLTAAEEPRTKVVVRRATYGVLDDPQRTRDVTAKVQRWADEESRFSVSSIAEGDDPAVDVRKTLVVEYAVEGRAMTVRARDGENIYLNPMAVNIKIEKARYGVLDDPTRTRDVAERLQRLLDAGENSFTVARMAEGDDPAFGIVKTLDLDYTRDGQRIRLTGTDPEKVDLAVGPVPPAAIVQVCRDASGQLGLLAREPGEYEMATSGGQTRRVTLDAAAPPLEIRGPWDVSFAPGGGSPPQVRLEKLISWSEHEDAGVKYFSGAATYRTTFAWQPAPAAAGASARCELDLGQVAVIAEAKLNGKELGVLWKPPFRVDVSETLQAGENALEIKVISLWINRMIGDEQLPEDSQRNPDGTLKAWPQWLLEGKPSPTGRFTFTSWRLWKKDSPLVDSGLLGPVILRTAWHVPVPE